MALYVGCVVYLTVCWIHTVATTPSRRTYLSDTQLDRQRMLKRAPFNMRPVYKVSADYMKSLQAKSIL